MESSGASPLMSNGEICFPSAADTTARRRHGYGTTATVSCWLPAHGHTGQARRACARA
ncbi:MAG: hypothetical protein BJ554DRAFT_7982, partial [Olpidium bornovanus]